MKLHLFSCLNNIGVSTMTNARLFRNLTFLVLSLLFAVDVFAQTEETTPLTNGVVFYSPCEHTAAEEGLYVPHRIPAIVKTRDGVICFADRRYAGGDVGQNKTDITIDLSWGSIETPWSNGTNGNRIDLMMRKSYDGGQTWTGDKRIVQGTDTYGYGDIAVVADWENPENILIMCAAGEESFHTSHGEYRILWTTNPASFLGTHRITSNDAGNTWTDHGAVTDAIYSAVGSDCDGAFFSSGKIYQSKTLKVGSHYRLYAALCTKVNNSDAAPALLGKTTYSVVLYSDDFGVTWNRLGGRAVTKGDEAKCEELPNGNVVVSSRTEGGRLFNIYNFTTKPTKDNPAGAGSWGTATEGIDANDQGTNGELLLIKAIGKDGEGLYALQSMPAGPSSGGTGRSNLAIFYKKIGDEDGNAIGDNYTNPATFASGWEEAIRVSNTTSAYSSMAMLDEKTIGFVYEEDYIGLGAGAYDIKFKKFSIEEIVEPGSMLKTMAQSDCENYSWATFFFDQNMTLPEGVTAYVATEIVDRTITIKAIGNVVPENTPVILIDRQDRPTIYLTYGGTFNESRRPETNGLVGATEKIEITDNNYKNYYVVGHGSRHVGLYYPSNRGIASGLAYYPLTSLQAQGVSGKSSYGFVFDDSGTTGISSANADGAHKRDAYYTLSGQAVEQPLHKGVYIKNGKKVIIK